MASLIDPAILPQSRSPSNPSPESPAERQILDIIEVKDDPSQDIPVEAIMEAMDIDSDNDSEKSGVETDDEISDEDK
jgi:hypothetical protein